jgi:hypothetical protein
MRAAERGHMSVWQWARDNGCPEPPSKKQRI